MRRSSSSKKYATQIDYLKKHSETKLLGTWVNMIDMKGNSQFILKHPVSYKEIKKQLYLNSTFVNSSVIFHTDILKVIGLFPEKYHRNGEDYAFFFNVSKKYKCENLPEILLDYEINPNSLSTIGRREQIRARINIIKDHFYWGKYPIYGLIRSYGLLFTPRNSITVLKKIKERFF